MNPPPQVSLFNLFCFTFTDLNESMQIGSRVRWWNSKGVLMKGTVQAINILSDVRCWTDCALDCAL